MNKTMTAYLNSLTDSNLDKLEQIISSQYRKFLRFYKLVSKHSDLIEGVKYEFDTAESLDIVLLFKNKKTSSEVCDKIKTDIEESKYDGSVKNEEKNIYLSIYLEED